MPNKRLHLEQLTIDLIDNGLIVIDPNGVELNGKKKFYVMLNFTLSGFSAIYVYLADQFNLG